MEEGLFEVCPSEKAGGAARDLADRFRGCLLGLAAGDAVGAAVEYLPRGTFPPLTDVSGGGPFKLRPGQWTDDTSMAMCLGLSLAETGRFDPRDQMCRYICWRDWGYLSSTGTCFDICGTVTRAIHGFSLTGNPFSGPTDPLSAGNGSIMRLAPVPMFYYPERDLALHYSAESSRTTHGAGECLDACRLLGDIIFRALDGREKEEVLFGTSPALLGTGPVRALARGDYRFKPEECVRGSGYVVECLEAALWCFLGADSFEGSVLRAANLGDDADTTAAVCGQVAGAFYGESGIPRAWLEKLAMRDEIAELADRLRRAGRERSGPGGVWKP